jgi:hypothetical protein
MVASQLQLSEEFSSGAARLRVDVFGGDPRAHVLDTTTFLNYRLADVRIEPQVTRPEADLVWDRSALSKAVKQEGDQVTLEGEWFQGELQKVIVSLLARRMEDVGLHPFHSSAVRYRDLTILFLGGESNHGKSMSQIEGCRRGGLVVSTETTVTDDQGVVVAGSKHVFLRERSKGTERADKLDQDQGVAKFFDETPEFVNYDTPSQVDLVVVPSIDGNFDPVVAELNPFERNFQTYHSLMNYLGLHELLAPGLVMPLLDSDERRERRADFCRRFCERRYLLIRAATPRVLFDQLEPLLATK